MATKIMGPSTHPRIACGSTRTVCLEELAPVLRLAWVEPGFGVRLLDEGPLGVLARHGDALPGTAILVDADLADDTLDVVAVADGVRELLEHKRGHALPSGIALDLFVPHA